MDSQPQFERLRRELAHQGLPRRYVQRVMEEMQDHKEDILEETPAASVSCVVEDSPAWQRLGDPVQIAKAIAKEYRSRTFVGRHPILSFLAAPIPLSFVAWLGWMVLFGLLIASFGELEPDRGTLQWPLLFIWSVLTCYYGSLVLPSALAAGLCCRWAYRSGRGTWSLAGCALIAVFAGLVVSSMKLSAVLHESCCMVGSVLLIPFVGHAGGPWSVSQQLIQMAVPLGIGAWFHVKQRRQVRRWLAVGH
jgi:hypothetical protein